MSYLFLVNIGPVQDFIASARRSRDLAFGSWFLSELARAAARQIVAENGLDSLIFPAPELEEMLRPNNKEFNVANKIVARIEQSPEKLGQRVHDAIKERLGEIKKEAYEEIALPGKERAIADEQIDDLVELLWVAHPYDGNKYKEMRLQLEALMAARKNTRNFKPVTGYPIPKSSIDGQLESVIPETAYASRGAPDAEKKMRSLYKIYGAGPAEQLSGVDLLKRRGTTPFGSSFPSTSHMATVPFLKRLEVFKDQNLEQVRKAWNTYIEKLKPIAISPDLERIPDNYPAHLILSNYEGSLLFEDRLVDVLYLPTATSARNSRLQGAKQALHDFYRSLDEQFAALGIRKAHATPYYALLQADGDGMGEVIDAQAEHGEQQHRLFSQALSRFAEQARGIIEGHQGTLVYAGGDDVLAFLPLHTVLQCARDLKTAFHNALQGFADQHDRPPTLSVGVAIIHHLESLREARNLAQGAERRAKRVDGKNALAITVSKRGGEDYSIAGSWGKIDADLEQLIEFCRDEAIPEGTAYELRDMVLRLTVSAHDQHADPEQEKITDTLHKVIKREALRILQRKLYVPVGKFPRERVTEVEEFLKARLGIEQKQMGEGSTTAIPLEEFINELIVARVLADARQLAELK